MKKFLIITLAVLSIFMAMVIFGQKKAEAKTKGMTNLLINQTMGAPGSNMIPISIEFSRIILDLAVRLKQHPDVQAYMISGPGKIPGVETIINSAATKIYGNLSSKDPLFELLGFMDYNQRGKQTLDEIFRERGIAGGGYSDDVVYIMNCDFSVNGREAIISLADQIRNLAK